MQLPGLALSITSVKIINTISHIRSLLNFGQQDTCPNGMHPSGRNKKDLSGLNGGTGQQGFQTLLLYRFQVVRLIYRFDKATDKAGPFFSLKQIPHLSLPKRIVSLAAQP